MNQEKQLDPTPSRIAKARREGNVPRSSELTASVAFAAAAATACGVVPLGAGIARDALYEAVTNSSREAHAPALLALALLPAAAGGIAAACVTFVQSGGLAVHGIDVQVQRLNPLEGLRRVLSRETLAHMARATAAFAVALCALGAILGQTISAASRADRFSGVAGAAWAGAQRTLFVAGAVGLVFALGEYALVRGTWLRRLRMSFEELKREIKEHEGDPHVRGRRRTLRRKLTRGAVQAVREAAFVVTNPTHLAIALAYRPPGIAVPRVLARAAEDVASRMRALAVRLGIPVVENPEVARALFLDASVGSAIPARHYVAVAEIVVSLSRSGMLR